MEHAGDDKCIKDPEEHSKNHFRTSRGRHERTGRPDWTSTPREIMRPTRDPCSQKSTMECIIKEVSSIDYKSPSNGSEEGLRGNDGGVGGEVDGFEGDR